MLVEVEPGRGRGGVRPWCLLSSSWHPTYVPRSPLIWSTLMPETWATSGLDLHLDLRLDRGPGPGRRRAAPPGAGPAGGGAARRGPDRTARAGHPAAVLPRAGRRPWPGPQHGGRGLRPAGRRRLADRATRLGHRGGRPRGGQRPGRSAAPHRPAAIRPGAVAASGPGNRLPGRAAAPSTPGPDWGRGPRYDLRPGSPDLSLFPRPGWLAAARRAVQAAPSDALGYADPRGRPELRDALASYLSRARGVRADPDRIVICAGFTQGLALLSQVLRARGVTTLAMEACGQPSHRELVQAAGAGPGPAPGGRGRRRGGPAGRQPGGRRAAHPGAPVPARRGAGPATPDPGHRLGPGHRGSGHRGRLRRRVPLRPPAGRRHAGPRARPGGLRRARPARAWPPGCAWAGWRCPPGWPTRWPPPAAWPTARAARSTSSRWPSSSARDGMTGRSAGPGWPTGGAATGWWPRCASRPRGGTSPASRPACTRCWNCRPALAEDDLVARAARRGLAVEGLGPYCAPGHPRGPALVLGYGTPPEHAFTGALARLCAVLAE